MPSAEERSSGAAITWSGRGLCMPYRPRREGAFIQAGAPRSFGDFAVDISSAERAVLEYLDGFPEDGSFEEARELVEGLTTLRLEVLQSLLEMCSSVKVKRIFLYLADQAKHPWRAELKDQRIELGRGKRSLVRKGKFDARYQITVPADPVESGA
jgi:hypothetical protein